jgi:DNA helicase II / ATP-dependent DNA helicase PcrA
MDVKLNPQQLKACEKTEGPLLILAGAGTGKTRVLTQRINYIISNGLAAPYQIMAVTFTNKAANEMSIRTAALTDINGIWIGTFHSLATKIIRSHTDALNLAKDFIIIDVDDQWRLLKKIVKDLGLDEQEFSPKLVSAIIGRWKDLGLFPENLTNADLTDYKLKKVKEVYIEYQRRLAQAFALDFGDLLLFCLKLFKEHPDILEYYQDKFAYIMVDEYQDTNATQYLWLRYLSMKNKNLCAVGDEDQSIYGWRGAEIRNILKFTHDFPGAEVIKLEQNYRSTQHILSTANHLIAHNSSRVGKNLWTEINSDQKVKIAALQNGIKEAEFITSSIKKLPSDIARKEVAVLVRASFQTRIIEEIFIQQQIPYKIIGGLKFFDRLEIKNAICYIRLSYNNNDSLALERIINVPKRGIGATTLAQIQEFSQKNQCSHYESLKSMLALGLFKGKTKPVLEDFIQKLDSWHQLYQSKPFFQVVEIILEESGYIKSLELEKTIESEARIENLQELINTLRDFDSVATFLEHVSLVNEQDEINDDNQVKIMTIHAAKGLEFDVVFLPGWEEGNFPSKRSMAERDGLEEERRLAYVAITRAKKIVYILYANSRFIYGEWVYSEPSVFLREIDKLPSVEYPLLGEKIFRSSLIANISNNVVQPTNSSDLAVGSQVMHKNFGRGRILSVEGEQVDVMFETQGRKRIIKTFLIKI